MTRKTDELARVFKVLAVKNRLRIVMALKGRTLCVGAIAVQLEVSQGAVSQHLRVMRDAGLVIDEKRGYYVHYRLNGQTLDRWRKQIDMVLALGEAPPRQCSRRIYKRCGAVHSRKERMP